MSSPRSSSRNPRHAASAGAAPGWVRIIGGRLRRSKLPVPRREGLRPTPDRVRETLFNWLGQDLHGLRCLDMFAGSGALGLEAVSRGAAAVTLLERDPGLAQALRQACERLGAVEATVQTRDALQFVAACPDASFDLVFIDPPFAAGLQRQALQSAARVLAPGGQVYLEAPDAVTLDTAAQGWEILRRAQAGQVHYALLRARSSSPG